MGMVLVYSQPATTAHLWGQVRFSVWVWQASDLGGGSSATIKPGPTTARTQTTTATMTDMTRTGDDGEGRKLGWWCAHHPAQVRGHFLEYSPALTSMPTWTTLEDVVIPGNGQLAVPF